jgi:peptidoglycan/xylan/chitin deacetylase (PgdA/CDA1 family)
VDGMPDLSAVRMHERSRPPEGGPRLARHIGAGEADAVLAAIAADYQADEDFRSFQGATATREDLRAAVERAGVWFGSHLYHHWDLYRIDDDLFAHSLRSNAEALSSYPNALPTLATPYGHEVDRLSGVAAEFDIPLVFVATGAQNRDTRASILDRVALEPEPSGHQEWWYATHRRRLFGGLAS